MDNFGVKYSIPFTSKQNGFDIFFWFSEQFGKPVNQNQQLCAPPSTCPARAPTAEKSDAEQTHPAPLIVFTWTDASKSVI